ncbi:MAG: alpha-amylase family glycosyl hydrolase, partial [Candidatus Hodarchaeales archaeon]
MPSIITNELKKRIMKKLDLLYDNNEEIFKELEILLKKFPKSQNSHNNNTFDKRSKKSKFNQKNVCLITYANSVLGIKGSPMQALFRFSKKYVQNIINSLHVLPFYPWDTDRGFSVLNYYEVDARNGNWEDFRELKNIFPYLMVDCVLNHASIDNPIVQGALLNFPQYKDFVLKFKDSDKPTQQELEKLLRPRPNPVLTRYYIIEYQDRVWASFNIPDQNKANHGIVKDSGWVWTTFSRPNSFDGTVTTKQADLNYKNPNLLIEMVKILLFYVSQGAKWIRLDANAYCWKEIGTTCIHLPQAHIIIQLLNDIFKIVNPSVVLIAEVNEPQEATFPYLGKEGEEEADMIYQFTHFPM